MKGVNVRLLRKTIATQGGERIASRANAALRDRFDDKKEQFLKAFDEDKVTQEIEAGPHYAGASEVDTGHGGNLFSLLGFKQDDKPIAELRQMLDKGITLDTNKKRVSTTDSGRILVEVPVNVISLEEIYDKTSAGHETKLPWTSRSFVHLIHRGITGFGKYVAGRFDSPKPSESGGGVQAKKPLREADLGPIKWLNGLLDTFKTSLKPSK